MAGFISFRTNDTLVNKFTCYLRNCVLGQSRPLPKLTAESQAETSKESGETPAPSAISIYQKYRVTHWNFFNVIHKRTILYSVSLAKNLTLPAKDPEDTL